MTDESLEQELAFLRGQVQRLGRIVDALENSPVIKTALVPSPPPPPKVPEKFIGRTLAEIEAEAIERTVDGCAGDLRKAAKILGVGKTTIYRKTDKRQRLQKRGRSGAI